MINFLTINFLLLTRYVFSLKRFKILSAYKRAILKFSGEVLRGRDDRGAISAEVVKGLCDEVKILRTDGFELGIVIGGGNIFRGVAANEDFGYDRITGDQIGMLATVLNAMAIADCLRRLGVDAEVFSAIPMPSVCNSYYTRDAQRAIDEGKVLLLAGGTGSAFFSTDSAAALRANELHADVVIKATKVDGVYDKDPRKHSDAKKFTKISFEEVLLKRLHVMDSTAFSLCMDNDIPIIVVEAEKDLKNIGRALHGELVGTTISND
jgi:uridylate kinase